MTKSSRDRRVLRRRWASFYRWYNHPENSCQIYADIAFFQEGREPEPGEIERVAHDTVTSALEDVAAGIPLPRRTAEMSQEEMDSWSK